MKDPLTIKAFICIGLTCTALAPKAIYWSSNQYIKLYNTTSTYISELSEESLEYVGLETIKPDDESVSSIIEKEASSFGVNPKLALALASHESKENPDALSLKGAIGVMQVMPSNYKRCGLRYKSDLWIKEKNIKCGLQIFSEELGVYKGNVEKALHAYNGGPKCVSKNGLESPCAESRKHSYQTLKLFAQSSIG